MFNYLGRRGRAVTLVVFVVVCAGAAVGIISSDWTDTAALLGLTYVIFVVGGLWGVASAILRDSRLLVTCSEEGAQLAADQRKGEVQQIQMLQRILKQTRKQDVHKRPVSTDAPTSTSGQAQNSVERRYAGVLDQPMSAPNSRLLSLLELLAKDATTRRADDAILRRAVSDLRGVVETQQVEISSLHRMVTTGDELAAPRSAV